MLKGGGGGGGLDAAVVQRRGQLPRRHRHQPHVSDVETDALQRPAREEGTQAGASQPHPPALQIAQIADGALHDQLIRSPRLIQHQQHHRTAIGPQAADRHHLHRGEGRHAVLPPQPSPGDLLRILGDDSPQLEASGSGQTLPLRQLEIGKAGPGRDGQGELGKTSPAATEPQDQQGSRKHRPAVQGADGSGRPIRDRHRVPFFLHRRRGANAATMEAL